MRWLCSFVVRGGGLPEFSLEGDFVVIRWAGAFSEFKHILGPTLHPSGPTLESSQDLHGGSTVRVCVCVFIKLHITAQSGPVILLIVILCHSH